MRFLIRISVLLLLVVAVPGIAQEASPTAVANQDQEKSQTQDVPAPDKNKDGYETLDVLITEDSEQEGNASESEETDELQAIPVPIQMGDEEPKSLGAQSYSDDVFRSTRNRWGFSLSAYQAYTSALYNGEGVGQSSGITAATSRIFFNFGRRKSQFHIDLGVGYRRYNRSDGFNSWDYDGNANYSYRLSRSVSFTLLDQFTSSYNDSWSFLSLYSPINYYPSFFK
jgi:hypothetical protein